jgi:argininosuccinate lyase
MVFYCIENNKAITDLSMDEMKSFSEIIEEDIYDAVSMETCVNDRAVIGGPAETVTLNAIKKAEEFLSSIE